MGEGIARRAAGPNGHQRDGESSQRKSFALQHEQIPYWMARQEEEEAAFLDAPDPRVRDVHHELAERYADAIWSAQEAEHEKAPQPFDRSAFIRKT